MKPACSKGTINIFVKRTLEGTFEKKLTVKTLAFSSSKSGYQSFVGKTIWQAGFVCPKE